MIKLLFIFAAENQRFKRNMSLNVEWDSPEYIKAFQEEKLRSLIKYLMEKSAYYRRVFAENGIDPSTINTLEDLRRVPLTDKGDLQRYNADFLCVPREMIADYMTTSGTLGDPVVFAATSKDLDRLAYNEKISFDQEKWRLSAGLRGGKVLRQPFPGHVREENGGGTFQNWDFREQEGGKQRGPSQDGPAGAREFPAA